MKFFKRKERKRQEEINGMILLWNLAGINNVTQCRRDILILYLGFIERSLFNVNY